MRSCLCGSSSARSAAWRYVGETSVVKHNFAGALPLTLRFLSSRRSSKRARGSMKQEDQPPKMDGGSDDGELFYIVRKGDIIGIYKNLSDCQAQVSNSVCDPSVGVYKGFSLRKDTKEYLAARGLQNALYSIHAADVKDELFANLVPCPFQQPDGLAVLVDQTSNNTSSLKRTHDMELEPPKKHLKAVEQEPLPDSYLSCILHFDGASKGNPGKAGAGAILRRIDGTVIAQLREGLGTATNNVAEYRALILGLKYAVKNGFKYIRVQGDSKLVCNQVQDIWRARNDNMADLCKKAKELKDKFLSFQISHILREYNSDADAQASLAVELPTGEVQEDSRFLF